MSGKEPAEDTYDLSLTGEGITISRKVPQSVAREIVGLVLGGPQGAGSASSGGGKPSTVSDSQVSLREYLNEAEATKNPEIITAIVDYVMKTTNAQSVSNTDIKARFRDAGEPAPGNLARDLGLAKGTGWIASDPHERNNYFVTQSGRDAIAKKFEGLKIRRPRRRTRKQTSDGETE